MHSLRISYSQATQRVLRYVKETTGWRLHFKCQGMISMDAYTNSNFSRSLVDRMSTTGYYVYLSRNHVTWRSKKQVVAWSSIETEFRALAHELIEIMWIKGILKDLKIKLKGPTRVLCDNQSTIRVAHNLVQHDKMKHVSINNHYIEEILEENNKSIPYIDSSEK